MSPQWTCWVKYVLKQLIHVLGIQKNYRNSLNNGDLIAAQMLEKPNVSRNMLTLVLLVANLANTKMMKKPEKWLETLAYGYSSESTQRALSNEYQHDRV